MDAAQFVRLRRLMGLSQSDMAQELGLSLRGVQNIENGESPLRRIHVLAAERIAIKFGIERKDYSLLDADSWRDLIDWVLAEWDRNVSAVFTEAGARFTRDALLQRTPLGAGPGSHTRNQARR
jgi:transcriptional regulator with XRE-family HTH domain